MSFSFDSASVQGAVIKLSVSVEVAETHQPND